ncbi:MAG TPA: adenylate/guanylate cyclase domain-containing protein [Acidimicrobiia bacterium]|nr:adenylate/guanylate cyclase domain-containing protein [Acidimicrobiia bacterium]
MPEHDLEQERAWRDVLTNPDSPIYRYGRIRKHIPGAPRCKLCSLPLGGVATPVLRLTGLGPSKGNPRFCNACEVWARNHPGGAEIELTLLFADVRGSTSLAEKAGPREFASLMQRFYRASTRVFIDSDAFLDKPVGDEVIALYLPLWGGDHAAKGLSAARSLLVDTGHADPGGPWIPVGIGVHTGLAYVGTVGVEGTKAYDVTALGDAVNVTARLASEARAGEILVSDSSYRASGLPFGDLEGRTIELRGRAEPLDVRVLTVEPGL